MKKGCLYMIPTGIAEEISKGQIPPMVLSTVAPLKYFLAENVRTARRYLSALKIFPSIEELQFSTVDKHTDLMLLEDCMKPLHEGHDMGMMSEAGCPGVADPGALVAQYAHIHGIKVIPLIGPSSLLMGLMASGLNGQQFAFHGYLPIAAVEAVKKIKALERESLEKQQTQIIIETPYRNQAVYGHFMKALNPKTKLCLAQDISGAREWIKTLTVGQWKKTKTLLGKRPAVFLFLAE